MQFDHPRFETPRPASLTKGPGRWRFQIPTIPLRRKCVYSTAAARAPSAHPRSLEPPDAPRTPASEALSPTSSQAHKSRCNPTPASGDHAPPSLATAAGPCPSPDSPVRPECARASRSKAREYRSAAPAPTQPARGFRTPRVHPVAFRLRRPPASRLVKWAKASRLPEPSAARC